MKKIVSALLCLVLALSLVGCEAKVDYPVSEFSYEEISAKYSGNEPGVVHTGFVNVTNEPISTAEDAVERAKNECTVAYDSVDVSFDAESNVWEVMFHIDGACGGDQEVYLNENGNTLLIVYGE